MIVYNKTMIRSCDADDLYEVALEVVFNDGKVSTSLLQKRLSIGYKRAQRLIKLMEQTSFITTEGKILTVLESAQEYQKIKKPRTLEQIAVKQGDYVDDIYLDALNIAKSEGAISINMLMRKLKIGYPRAARLMEQLAVMGEIELNLKNRKSKYVGSSKNV